MKKLSFYLVLLMLLAISFEASAMEILANCNHEFSEWKLV